MEEKIITLNLRKEIVKARRIKKSKIALSALRKKIQKMFKGLEVKIDKSVNEFIWKRGAKKPSTRVRVRVLKEDKKVKVELVK
ncbi:MAG: 50S ribosomal protein L31e [Candidatus Aenigmatarchaeota archaeon]